MKGKLNTTLEQIEHGHHIFRAYFKHAFVKQYEKFATFLRNEICSNNLSDFNLKKGLEHLALVREKFLAITDRFAHRPLRHLPGAIVERSRRVPPLADPRRHPDHLPTPGCALWLESTPLPSAQDEGAWGCSSATAKAAPTD
jgi:hypothetical protein